MKRIKLFVVSLAVLAVVWASFGQNSQAMLEAGKNNSATLSQSGSAN